MAGKIEIDTGILGHTIGDIESDICNIRSHIEEVYRGVTELNTMWEGTANQAFNMQFHRDRVELLKICQELADYTEKVRFAKDEYNRCEHRVSGVVNAIRV